jgi:RNA polymerase sigma-70 factor (ECF subfamily)
MSLQPEGPGPGGPLPDEPATDGPAAAEPDDRALLAAHVAGDPDAFTVLVRRHRDRLWAVALRTSGEPEEAADALQDALLSAYRNAASFRGEAAVTTWLHRVVVNACLDRHRRRKVRATVPLPDDAEGGDRTAVVDPHDRLAERELALEVERALADLPPDQRAAIVLVDLEGYSVGDAADLLGCPEGTVKSRCSRGRAKLAVSLAHLRNPDTGTGVPSPYQRDYPPDPPALDHPGAAGPAPRPPDQPPDPSPQGGDPAR